MEKYNRIWIESSEHPRQLLELNKVEMMALHRTFGVQWERYLERGYFIVLSPGETFDSDELLVFQNASSAWAFYLSGFAMWESFIGHDNEGCGFQELSLFQDRDQLECKPYLSALKTQELEFTRWEVSGDVGESRH